jgi:hypothetical protein
MTDWMEEYAATDDHDEKYDLLREEMTRLRGEGSVFDREAVVETVRELGEATEGVLVVFVANDFGLPMAYRPEGTGIEVQDAVRRAILENKYDSNEDLNGLRRALLDDQPAIHKAILAEFDEGRVRYHLPEGSSSATNFVTVREMVGLIDYTTNSSQSDALSMTY